MSLLRHRQRDTRSVRSRDLARARSLSRSKVELSAPNSECVCVCVCECKFSLIITLGLLFNASGGGADARASFMALNCARARIRFLHPKTSHSNLHPFTRCFSLLLLATFKRGHKQTKAKHLLVRQMHRANITTPTPTNKNARNRICRQNFHRLRWNYS